MLGVSFIVQPFSEIKGVCAVFMFYLLMTKFIIVEDVFAKWQVGHFNDSTWSVFDLSNVGMDLIYSICFIGI